MNLFGKRPGIFWYFRSPTMQATFNTDTCYLGECRRASLMDTDENAHSAGLLSRMPNHSSSFYSLGKISSVSPEFYRWKQFCHYRPLQSEGSAARSRLDGAYLKYAIPSAKIQSWAYYRLHKIVGCACVGNVFPSTVFKENSWLAIPACITACASCMCRYARRDR